QDDNAAVRIPLMVPAASHRLLEYLKARYHNFSAFLAEAVQRIIGKQSRPQQLPRFPSPRTSLERLKPEDTTLFVEEKQNLYIDEAKEAGIWLDVLLSMDSSAIETETLRKLESWTLEGIDALVETASTEFDGPLGWTSKPEVLTLGVRILHAAHALMHYSRNESLSVDGSRLRTRLKDMLVVGEQSQ
ncbi:MAG: hypothetical protein Q9180_009953, partial [Flavoplaca navasiana]